MTESCSEKKLNICVLKGSPNRNGFTEQMLSAFIANFPYTSIEIFDAYAIDAKPCIDCKFCSQTFGCISKDLDDFFKAYESCDVFVAAFPVYFLSLPAPMKSILDRFQKYFSARFVLNVRKPVVKERIGILLSSCGSGDETGFSVVLKQWKMAFSVSGIKRIESIFISGTDSESITEEMLLQKMEKIVYKINMFQREM